MNVRQTSAYDLLQKLTAAGIGASVEGAGVHWNVNAAPVGTRSMRIACFWYERTISGLLLGMNPSNARSSLRTKRVPYEGPEYLVALLEGEARVADGRTYKVEDVVVAAQAWLAGRELDQVVHDAPFIDEKGRAIRALAERVPTHLRRDIGGDPSYELWVYGDSRSCEVTTRDGAVACKFFLGQAQVAFGEAVEDLPAAVGTWLIDGASLKQLAARVPGVELERHAEVLEADPARWHWLHVRDRLANPRDVLAPLRELLERLTRSPIATKFYSYSSLNRFCFSASSHYPWVDHGLPLVAPTGGSGYFVNETRCDLESALHMIETRLASTSLRPFFGSAPHHELPLVSESLARQGSELRPTLKQHGAWFSLDVSSASGLRRCRVSSRGVAFFEGSAELRANWPTLDAAIGAVIRFCDNNASLEEIAADPSALRPMLGKAAQNL